MTVGLLQTLSLVAYIASAVLFILAIALFFILDVPKLYGDISGKTAKKAIKAIREQNESTTGRAYKPSKVNAERGKITDKITRSGRLESKTSGLSISVGTEKFATSTLAPKSNETTLLQEGANETTVLEQPRTDPEFVTSELPAFGETEVLVRREETIQHDIAVSPILFATEVEISFTESSEIIE